jgi:hypothetical protein
MILKGRRFFMKGKSVFPRIAVALALSLVLLVSFACAGGQTAAKKPATSSTVTVTPESGAKGSEISIAGAGFRTGEEIDIILIMGPGQRVGLGTVKVDAIVADQNGAFTAVSNIPSWATPGTYDIEVEGSSGSEAKTKVEVK